MTADRSTLEAQGDQGATRTERDSLGELQVPVSAYYGVQTMRAHLNFPISDLRFPRSFIKAIGQVKGAAAQANMDLGLLDQHVVHAVGAGERA